MLGYLLIVITPPNVLLHYNMIQYITIGYDMIQYITIGYDMIQ